MKCCFSWPFNRILQLGDDVVLVGNHLDRVTALQLGSLKLGEDSRLIQLLSDASACCRINLSVARIWLVSELCSAPLSRPVDLQLGAVPNRQKMIGNVLTRSWQRFKLGRCWRSVHLDGSILPSQAVAISSQTARGLECNSLRDYILEPKHTQAILPITVRLLK